MKLKKILFLMVLFIFCNSCKDEIPVLEYKAGKEHNKILDYFIKNKKQNENAFNFYVNYCKKNNVTPLLKNEKESIKKLEILKKSYKEYAKTGKLNLDNNFDAYTNQIVNEIANIIYTQKYQQSIKSINDLSYKVYNNTGVSSVNKDNLLNTLSIAKHSIIYWNEEQPKIIKKMGPIGNYVDTMSTIYFSENATGGSWFVDGMNAYSAFMSYFIAGPYL